MFSLSNNEIEQVSGGAIEDIIYNNYPYIKPNDFSFRFPGESVLAGLIYEQASSRAGKPGCEGVR